MFETMSTRSKIIAGVTAAGALATIASAIIDKVQSKKTEAVDEEICEEETIEVVDPTEEVA